MDLKRGWRENQGVIAALVAAALLGSAPIIGLIAYANAVSPLGLAAARTALAALLLWVVYGVTRREYLYIFPVGLAECALAGAVNGVGSLFYYAGLKSLDNASLAQLLYTTYPLFVAVLLRLDGHRLSRLTLVRLVLTLVAIYLLTTSGVNPIEFWESGLDQPHVLGVVMLLASAIFFAFHVVFSQRALYDVPPPTVTIYSLTAMAVTVLVAWLIAGLLGAELLVGKNMWALPSNDGLIAIGVLALSTALSRLTLFVGVKRLGGLQTTLLSVGELVVALLAAKFWLGESLAVGQWLGALLLMFTQLLISRERLDGGSPRPRIRMVPPLESIADQ